MSGFQQKFAPSVDRIDNTQGYILGNLQWLTLSANSKKYVFDETQDAQATTLAT